MSKRSHAQAAVGSTRVGGAAPGTPDDAGKKAKKAKRAAHPLVGSKDAKVYPFTEVPKDFDPTKHKPLKKKDFSADHLYFTYKADELRAKAKAMDEHAALAKKVGSSKERSQAKRLLKLRDKMAELRKQLEADGVDVDSVLAVTKDDTKED